MPGTLLAVFEQQSTGMEQRRTVFCILLILLFRPAPNCVYCIE